MADVAPSPNPFDGPSEGAQPVAAAPSAEASANPFDGPSEPPLPGPAPPPAPPPKKTVGDRVAAFTKGALGQSSNALELLGLAGATPAMLADKIHSAVSGVQHTDLQDRWFKDSVDPTIENKQMFDLPANSDFGDKFAHGMGGTMMMIAQAIATGGEGAAAAAPTTLAGRAAVGAAQMQAPAAINAVDVGNQVMQATGDQKAALAAGLTSYSVNALSGAIPMGVGAGRVARVATAAATGGALNEVSRVAQNAAMPDDMQTPFNLQDDAVAALTTAPFGLLGHGPVPHQAVEARTDIISHAQDVAAHEAIANGGDTLDGVVAATHVGSVLGAHYHAAQFEMHLEEGHASAANAENQLRLETAQEEAARSPSAAFDQAEEPSTAPSPDDAYAQRDQEQQAAKDQDYTAAQNQVGDQTVAAADAGSAGFEPPTLGDNPVLQTLKARRAAAGAEPTPEPDTTDRLKAQNPEDDFMPYTPPKGEAEAPQTLAERRAVAGAGTEPVDMTKPPEERALRREGIAAARAKEEGITPEPEAEPVPANAAEREGEAARRDATDIPEPPTDDEPPSGGGKPQTLKERRAERQFKQQQRDSPSFRDAEAPAGRLTAEQAEDYVRPLRDETGAKIQVHADASTLPTHIQKAMIDTNHPSPRGVNSRGVIHLVAGAHDSPEALQRTAVHELAHHNMRETLGPEFNDQMRDIYQNIHGSETPVGIKKGTARDWMRDYMADHNLDRDNPDHQATAANEYAAYLAEHPTENPGVLRRAVDAVRGGLRRIGVVHEWTDNDIRALLRKSGTPRIEGRAAEPHFADEEESSQERGARAAGDALKGKATVEDQMGPDTRSAGQKVKDFASDNWNKTLDARLSGISLHNLPDFISEKLMPSARAFSRTVQRQTGRKGRLTATKADVARDWEKWGKKNPEHDKSLQQIMGASTLGGVDPSKPFETRYSDKEKADDAAKAKHEAMREGLHAELKKRYDALDPKGRELYKTVRDSYSSDRKAVLAGLYKRIEDAGLDDNAKKQMMTTLRKQFESNQVQGPYFPLARFGDRWAVAKHADGSVASFSRFESKPEMKNWMDQRRAEGFTGDGQLEGGEKVYHRDTIDKIDPDFVAKVVGILKGTTKDGAPIDPKGELQDEIWQEYLKSMPEMSMRKHFIHRQGRLGYTADQRRAFAYNGFHNAHQIARLEYGHQLDGILDDMDNERQAIEKADPLHTNADKANALAREFAKRYEWIKKPSASPLASALTRFGSAWYLGAAPATALRIGMQNPMIALPTLAGRHGYVGAYKELSRSMAQWIGAKGSLGDRLRGDERKAFDEASDMGVFSNTATQMLASGGGGDPMYVGAKNAAVRAAQFLFNGAEHLNRQSTYLAAYRLARQDGMGHEDAVYHAVDMSRLSHFDYSNENRPRILQSNVAKVVGLFKSYSAGVTYRLGREFVDSISNDSPVDKAIARKTFAGLVAHQFAFGGAVGVPMMWAALGAVNIALSTKDQPFDARAAAYEYLKEHLGQFGADSVMTGPVGAATGASLSGGANYSDLWYRTPTKDMTVGEQATDALSQALGAVAAIPLNMATGAQMIAQGHTERGLEHFVPPEAAALMKAVRYSQEGVTNLHGETILSKDELTGYELGMQAAGLTPQKIADVYSWSGARKNMEKQIEDRHQLLQNQWNAAISSGDSDSIKEASENLANFFQAHTGYSRNPGKSMMQSYKGQAKRAATSVGGINMNPGLRGDLDSTYGSSPFPQEAPP